MTRIEIGLPITPPPRREAPVPARKINISDVPTVSGYMACHLVEVQQKLTKINAEWNDIMWRVRRADTSGLAWAVDDLRRMVNKLSRELDTLKYAIGSMESHQDIAEVLDLSRAQQVKAQQR